MAETSENFSGTVKVAGREITNVRFADDIDLIAGSKEELEDLTTRLDTVVRKHGMEIGAEKSKTMVTARTNVEDTSDVQIKVGDVGSEEVQTFQYLGSTLNTDVTSEQEIKKRLEIATNQLAKLSRICSSSGIATATKIRLMRSLLTSMLCMDVNRGHTERRWKNE